MLLASVLIATLATAPKPNIIYIMADDLGYGDLGCYGQKLIPTPNIDRLAAQGIKMTRSYSASPVCAPTRCSLLTGKHQGHAWIRGNKEQGGFGPNDKEGQEPLPASETTVAEILKQAGYRTGIVGKWAMGGSSPGQFPRDHGFDFFYGYLCQRRAHNFYPPYLWKNTEVDLLDNPVYSAHQKITAPLEKESDYYTKYGGKTYSATKLMEHCVNFIQGKNANQPFFLYYAPTLPHVALQAPKSWVDKFPREWDEKPYLGQNGYLPCARPRATYAAMVAYLDFTVGEIMKTLETTHQAENTLIIFTSDNGAVDQVGGADRSFFSSNGVLRAGKMSLYEGGVRVPFVARWPGKIKSASTSNHPFVCYDAMQTFCEVAGVKSPKSDGISYLPALTGASQKMHPFLYFEYPEASAMQSVQFGKWKVIFPNLNNLPSKVELYDLDVDPAEEHDLASLHPDLVAKGRKLMQQQHDPSSLFPLGKKEKPNTQ